MTDKDSTHGLSCPNCGGTVPVPEGQVIVQCPYCDLRSMVRGERGLQRYQVPRRIEKEQAVKALQGFFSQHQAIARDAARRASLEEAFVAYLPFWASWARVLGWVFGQKRVGSGDHAHYEPREVQIIQDSSWNGAACDVGEFGVETVTLGGQPLEPFDPESLHQTGMVFEPVGSVSDAQTAARNDFNDRIHKSARLDRIAQVFARFVQQRFGLVYYPLWVIRYLYRGRSYQVVVDGFSGQVLFGKAPGNTLYRAAILVGGMALGALIAVDGPALALYIAGNSNGDGSGGFLIGALVLLVVGFGVIAAAYRTFRYGEQFEYRKGGSSFLPGAFQPKEIFSQIEDLDVWINRLS